MSAQGDPRNCVSSRGENTLREEQKAKKREREILVVTGFSQGKREKVKRESIP